MLGPYCARVKYRAIIDQSYPRANQAAGSLRITLRSRLGQDFSARRGVVSRYFREPAQETWLLQ